MALLYSQFCSHPTIIPQHFSHPPKTKTQLAVTPCPPTTHSLTSRPSLTYFLSYGLVCSEYCINEITHPVWCSVKRFFYLA